MIILSFTLNGKIVENFDIEISKILTECIINFFEKSIINRIINYNYFYFKPNEKKVIGHNCYEILLMEEQYFNRSSIISDEIYNYIKSKKTIILDGFVNFRLPDYTKFLDSIVDFSVNKYIIDKEYLEFIKLLKNYINSTPSKINLIHLIHVNGEFILVDETHNLITMSTEISKKNNLSDISFSNNDYVLNTLLDLLPKKIYIHLTHGGSDSNEFIDTLSAIFSNRISICKKCNICKTYNLIQCYTRSERITSFRGYPHDSIFNIIYICISFLL